LPVIINYKRYHLYVFDNFDIYKNIFIKYLVMRINRFCFELIYFKALIHNNNAAVKCREKKLNISDEETYIVQKFIKIVKYPIMLKGRSKFLIL
jgi:hypothetical protein